MTEALGIGLPKYDEVRVESAEPTDVAPAEYHADLVVLLVEGKPVFAIAVEVPIVDDVERALSDPELAILSVMAHGKGDVEQAVRIGIAAVAGAESRRSDGLSVLYSDLIELALSEAARKALRMLPESYELQSESGKRYAAGQAAAILTVLEARELSVTEEQRNRILSCVNLTSLDRWLRRAATASSGDELFAPATRST
jgi:hypothetical protein